MTVLVNGVALPSASYTIIPVNNNFDNGGNVTLSTACTSGSTLILNRVTPITQQSKLYDNMPIPMTTLENGLDKSIMVNQEIWGRTIHSIYMQQSGGDVGKPASGGDVTLNFANCTVTPDQTGQVPATHNTFTVLCPGGNGIAVPGALGEPMFGTGSSVTSKLTELEADIMPGNDICEKANAAINALPLSGGKVTFECKDNTAQCQGPIIINKPSVTLQGCGAGQIQGVTFGATTIHFAPGVPGIVADGTGPGNNPSRPQIKGITLAGSDSAPGTNNGIYLRNAGIPTIDDMAVKGFGGIGVLLDNNTDRFNLTRIEADSNWGNGFQIGALPCLGDINVGYGENLSSTSNHGWGFSWPCGNTNTWQTLHGAFNDLGCGTIGTGHNRIRAMYCEGGSLFRLESAQAEYDDIDFPFFGQPTIEDHGVTLANRLSFNVGAGFSGIWPSQRFLNISDLPNPIPQHIYSFFADNNGLNILDLNNPTFPYNAIVLAQFNNPVGWHFLSPMRFDQWVDLIPIPTPTNPVVGCRFYIDSATGLFSGKTVSGANCLPSGGGSGGAVNSVTGAGSVSCSPTTGDVVCTGTGGGGGIGNLTGTLTPGTVPVASAPTVLIDSNLTDIAGLLQYNGANGFAVNTPGPSSISIGSGSAACGTATACSAYAGNNIVPPGLSGHGTFRFDNALEKFRCKEGTSAEVDCIGAGGGGAVASVFGRTGAVVAATNDYSFAQISGSLAHAQLPTLLSADIPNNAASTTGNALTASGLVAAPSLCPTGQSPTGVLANGNVTGCQAVGATAPGAQNDVLSSNGAGSAQVDTGVFYYNPTTHQLFVPQINGTGTWTGNDSWATGTGSIPALSANSAGFSGPLTGGTSYLLKLPATMTAGMLAWAAPGTLEGVNQSQGSIVPIATTATANSMVKSLAGGTIDSSFLTALPTGATVPTQAPGTNNTTVASTAFVADAVTSAGGGNLSNSGTPTIHQVGVFVDATHIGGLTQGVHQVMVGQTSADPAAKTVPNCVDTGGNHLNFTQATDAWSCGTSGTGGVTVSGSPSAGNIAKFTSATDITNASGADIKAAAGIGELCHNYTPGSGSSSSNVVLISCTPSASLVVNAHYRIIAGMKLTTTTTPTGSIVQINQGGLGSGGGTVLCSTTNAGAAPTASVIADGSMSCEFTVTSSTVGSTFGGILTLTNPTSAYNKGVSWDNGVALTTTGTPTIDLVISTAGTNSTWIGENIVVYRIY